MTDSRSQVRSVLASINTAWQEGHPLSMKDHLDPRIVMALPGFSGSVEGRDTLLEGFAEFCNSARVHEYEETGERIDVVADTAVATYRFRMLYERAGEHWLSTGRDVWVFQRQNGQRQNGQQQTGRWIAVWRTMTDLAEEPASGR